MRTATIHDYCFVCGSGTRHGLGLKFATNPDGSVVATFRGTKALAGYPGRLHGGIVASLLDGAMTNRAFAAGIVAVTADLRVRYHRAVPLDESIVVTADIDRVRGPLTLMHAEISQDDVVLASATGKFLTYDPDAERPGRAG